MLILLSFAGQTLAATDTLPPTSAATQKKTAKGNSADKGKDWKYMNRHKVWDANRKEFTYPENWVEPEKDNATASGKPGQKHIPKTNNK